MTSKEYGSLKVAELKELCKERGITIPKGAKKDDIVLLLEDSDSTDDTVVVVAEVIEEPEQSSEKGLAVTFNAGVIQANFDSLESFMDTTIAQYNGWEPSAENKDDLESIKAVKKEFKGIIDGIETRRKEVNRAYTPPLDAFNARCKAIVDKGKKFYEKLRDVEREADDYYKSEKKNELREHYEAFAGMLLDVVPYEKIHDDRWLLKGTNIQTAKAEIEDIVQKIAGDREAIKDMHLEFENDALTVFYQTLNFGEAIKYARKLEEDKRKVEEMEAELARQSAQPIPEEDTYTGGADAYNAEAPEDYVPYEPQDPMTMEQEHQAYNPPNAYQPPQPEPPQYAPDVTVESLINQAIELSGGMVKDVFKAVVNHIRTPFGGNENPAPCVAIFDAATPRQMDVIGKCAGAVGTTMRFYHGTMQEAYNAWYTEQANNQQGGAQYVR